jgi:hypothetical protein
MAKDKKSFVLYCDLIHEIDHLTDAEKGKLFQHLLEYVNDMNPVMDDRVLLGSWKHIQRQLKRDLVKYEEKREQNRVNARKRWDAVAYERKQTDANHAVNDTDNVNVNDNDIQIGRDFEIFFEAYSKKLDHVLCQREWLNIERPEHAKILEHVQKYVKATPDTKYRKKPLNYLKDRTWLDPELPNQHQETKKPIETYKPNLIYPK